MRNDELAESLGLHRRDPPPQPAPVGGRGDVWVDVIQHLDEMDLPASLRAKCEARRELGLQRYGVLLGYDDGRDPVRDLEEELLDGAAYAWRLGLRRLTRDLLRFAANPELADVELREADDRCCGSGSAGVVTSTAGWRTARRTTRRMTDLTTDPQRVTCRGCLRAMERAQ